MHKTGGNIIIVSSIPEPRSAILDSGDAGGYITETYEIRKKKEISVDITREKSSAVDYFSSKFIEG